MSLHTRNQSRELRSLRPLKSRSEQVFPRALTQAIPSRGSLIALGRGVLRLCEPILRPCILLSKANTPQSLPFRT